MTTYKDLTNEILEDHTEKKVVYFKQHDIFKEYVRVHHDNERYLADYTDIKISDIKIIDCKFCGVCDIIYDLAKRPFCKKCGRKQ